MTLEDVPTYGLLVINHAYNEGNITFKEWLELSRQWAMKIIEQYDGETAEYLPLHVTIRKELISQLALLRDGTDTNVGTIRLFTSYTISKPGLM